MMGGPYVGNAATFLIQTLFGLYILLVMLRFLLQWVRADFYNPVSQFIVKATQPPLAPLRRIIPGVAGLDVAALVFMFALKLIELWLVIGLMGKDAPLGALAVLSVSELLGLMFACLRTLDAQAAPGQVIAVARIPEEGLGRAINDRLRRAAAPR